jgi:hypothetical protein
MMEKKYNPVSEAQRKPKAPKSVIWRSVVVVNPEQGTIDRIMPSGEKRLDIGAFSRGYKKVNFLGKVLPVQRVIWEHVHGPVPEGMLVDHINGDRSDNRIANLRLVTPSQNTQNQHKPRKDNQSSGIKGVTFYKPTKTWQAQIKALGTYHYLGRYKTKEEAALAYQAGAAKYHTHNPYAQKVAQ